MKLSIDLDVPIDTACLIADREPKAQLTIHLDGPVLRSGGTLLVVANPVPKQEWDKLPTLPANARLTDNPKAAAMKPGEKLFEASVSSGVSIVELTYPEGGSFGFNLVAGADDATSPPLPSTRLTVGSGYCTDRQTGKKIEWKDVSTIHIHGPEVEEAQSRLVRASSSAIMNAYPAKTQQPGVTVYAPTAEELERALFKDPT